MMKFLAEFFPSLGRQALPFKPLATINMPTEAPRANSWPFRRAPSAPQKVEMGCSGRHTNQLSS